MITSGVRPKSDRIYEPQFWMLCCSSLFFFASFNMIIPELPAYLSSLGGSEYKGLIISLFTITAMISRPFSGKLADTIGRVPVVMIGSAVCLICSLLYPVLTTVAGLLVLRLVHGFSTGFTPTGQAAYLSDVIPSNRRGEAMGLLGTAGTLGMAAGPALGGFVAHEFGINAVFYLSAGFALLSIGIVFNLGETLSAKRKFHPEILAIRKSDLFEPSVLTPCIAMVLTAYSYGALFTLIPDFSEISGMQNKGLLFTYLLVSSLLIRLLAGKASDVYGRRPVLIFSTLLISCSMLVLARAESTLQVTIGIIMYGLGQGSTSPTLLAWATDLSNVNFKGRGISSLYISMEFGIGIGAFVSGFVYANDPGNFPLTFGICSVLSLIAFVFLLAGRTPKINT
jgi:MFS family permease